MRLPLALPVHAAANVGRVLASCLQSRKNGLCVDELTPRVRAYIDQTDRIPYVFHFAIVIRK
jgi:hypothetical protein